MEYPETFTNERMPVDIHSDELAQKISRPDFYGFDMFDFDHRIKFNQTKALKFY